MESLAFVRALQLSDSFFPVGAFAYSDGLETAASAGLVHDSDSLGAWMDHFIDGVFVPCEGLALFQCMTAMNEGDVHRIIAIDEELSAIRPAGAVRRASALAGRRLLSLYASIGSDDRFESIAKSLPYGNAAAAYALVFSHEGIGEREAVLAFGYNRLAGMVSAGLRLIAIGQQQGQTLLSKAIHRLPDTAAQIVNNAAEPLRAFSPLLDIQQMNHQYIYSRLFRS